MKDEASRIRASKMHYQTDIWIEIPAFTVVLTSGLLMLTESHLSGVFLYKIIFAALAIAFNLICVYAVWKRRQYALRGDIEGMKSTDGAMKLGGLIIPTFLIAFGLSIYLAW